MVVVWGDSYYYLYIYFFIFVRNILDDYEDFYMDTVINIFIVLIIGMGIVELVDEVKKRFKPHQQYIAIIAIIFIITICLAVNKALQIYTF